MATEYPPAFVRDEIDGVKVVKDEVLGSGLSFKKGRGFVPIHSTRVLTLENDEVVYGCRDCVFAGTRGQVRQHRRAEHGIDRPKPNQTFEQADAAGDVIGRRLPYPSPDALSMTLWELLDRGEKLGDYEDAIAAQDLVIADLREQLMEARHGEAEARKELARQTAKLRRIVEG